MKLLLCGICQDVVKIGTKEKRFCMCKESWCRTVDDDKQVEVSDHPNAIVLGVDNRTLKTAVVVKHIHKKGIEFDAFVITDDCEAVTRTK
jgi:hypothetical protein